MKNARGTAGPVLGGADATGGGGVGGMGVGRAAKEEHMFNELGYLAPPNPPDELERRRALYKCVFSVLLCTLARGIELNEHVRFNIWNTGLDSNFDRICHLVKLVFSTKIVVISLVDGTEM